MADKISALIFSALASDAEKPRASKMFPLTIWAGLFSAALFMCPLLLQSLLHPFQSLPGHLEVTSVRLPALLLKAVQHVNRVSHLGQIDRPVPSALIGLFQFEDPGTDGTHAARLRCRLPAYLELPQRESERPLDLIGKARQHLQGIPFKVKFGG